ncbi:MAG: hypothetical protein H0S80_12225 [Desulfovibrionaceae bacterium]|nr:hypothetical protein [Desulfovibrionaceae bacterium]
MKKKVQILILSLSLLPVVYFLFIASDMYVSTVKFAVRGQKDMSLGGLASILGAGGSNTPDCYLVQEYIQSFDMYKAIDAKLDLKSHYSSDSVDSISRMATNASSERQLAYWLSVAQADFDSQTSILTVDVRAFSPEMAKAITEEVLSKSEDLMNHLNDRVREDSLKLALNEVKLAEKRYSASKTQLSAFRSRNLELDPSATAHSRIGIIASLESQISMLSVDLETKEQFMSTHSFEVSSLKENIAKLSSQLTKERERLTGSSNPIMLSQLEEYEALLLENEFARNYYTSALNALESARIMSESKTVYLEAIQNPQLPDEALYPERISFSILSVVVVALGYALILFIIAAVKEHIGV